MLELFVIIVAAIIVANIIMSAAAFALVASKPFVKWWTKKIMKTAMEIEREMYEEGE